METNQTVSTDLVPVEEFKQIIEAAPTALKINSDKIEKAVAAGQNLLDEISANGMNDELDQRCNGYLVKLKNTYIDLNDRRKPLTELFDKIRTVFTDLENKIDSKKKGNIYESIQAERNKYATAKIVEQKKREEEAARKLAKDKALINLKALAETNVRNIFIAHLEKAKQNLTKCFESLTLDNWDINLRMFQEYPLHYRIDEWEAIVPVGQDSGISPLISVDEWRQVNVNAKLGKFDAWAGEYYTAMGELHQELAQRINSKHIELTEIANAKGAEKKRLAEEAEERKKAEAIRLAEEAEESRRKNAELVEANKNVELTNSLFDSQLTVQESAAETKAIESYSIEVKNSSAWLLIVNFYFTKEGLKEDPASLEKKTLGSMKKFAESVCKKTGEKIESPYLVYSPVYNVRATK